MMLRRISCTLALLATGTILGSLTLSAQEARINLGPVVNTEVSELQPIITSDEQVLFFTRKGDPRNAGFSTKPDDEDIWFSVRLPNGDWTEAEHLEGPLNTAGYDGVRAVNSAFTRLYLQNKYNPDGTRSKGFSVSERAPDGSWNYPTALEIENYYNDTTTATLGISHDENVLIMSLRRKDSKGGHDLYVSFKTGPYTFSEPQNILNLSTLGDEVAPHIGFDNRTIYFPSTGWGADNGTHDIFISRRLDDTWLNWSRPEKLPFPINTASADFYINLSARGDTVYLSSWHESSTRGFGRSDIWKAGMPRRYRPASFGDEADTGAIAGVERAPDPVVGSLIRLENIFFDTDRSTLRSESKNSLDRLIALLQEYPKMRIEIQGHTDSDGSDDHNNQLSDARAKSVVEYLVQGGIARPRLEGKGYGETVPIAPNTTAAGKQLNRRVMVLIKGYDYEG
jgi:outer membrane protein OmpA-like peptidoglycan-associated protein